ncbi:hypothetical protein NEHOM01_1519 [Nematocida homosporus]|uniref:uncharacterized protein n=1 Tax=Nematocida homosporus TaxID=1912981 RepID=UPI002220715D|nr:uncharacterized protein NEHOM01_1519 [Nematocida homosporus]KAI5186519.1 hypothetical protein NEHOM01_1519 [Nematocida homosporus]
MTGASINEIHFTLLDAMQKLPVGVYWTNNVVSVVAILFAIFCVLYLIDNAKRSCSRLRQYNEVLKKTAGKEVDEQTVLRVIDDFVKGRTGSYADSWLGQFFRWLSGGKMVVVFLVGIGAIIMLVFCWGYILDIYLSQFKSLYGPEYVSIT